MTIFLLCICLKSDIFGFVRFFFWIFWPFMAIFGFFGFFLRNIFYLITYIFFFGGGWVWLFELFLKTFFVFKKNKLDLFKIIRYFRVLFNFLDFLAIFEFFLIYWIFWIFLKHLQNFQFVCVDLLSSQDLKKLSIPVYHENTMYIYD